MRQPRKSKGTGVAMTTVSLNRQSLQTNHCRSYKRTRDRSGKYARKEPTVRSASSAVEDRKKTSKASVRASTGAGEATMT